MADSQRRRLEREELKQKYIEKAERLVKKHGVLNIIYLRVSTKIENKQEEGDQLKNILDMFGLDIKKCLIMKSKESAFQLSKQKFREFNIIFDLLESLAPEVEKNCYFWKLDRMYRNRELAKEFYRICKLSNGNIYSFCEPFINSMVEAKKQMPSEIHWIMDMEVERLIQFFTWLAERESIDKGKRLMKSLTQNEGRYYTNKGNLFGGKLTYTNGKKITDSEFLDKLEDSIYNKIREGKLTYREIIDLVAEKAKVKISMGYLTNLKNKVEKSDS